HINLISGGFTPYFKKFTTLNYSTYPNGIDEVFLNLPLSESGSIDGPKTITYAGNMGEGQGLHIIVPQAAKALGKDYKFKLIGDGGAKQKLVEELDRLEVQNVEFIP